MTKTNSKPWLKSSASIKGNIPNPRKNESTPSPHHSLFHPLSVFQKKFQQINYTQIVSNIDLFSTNLIRINKVTFTSINAGDSDLILYKVSKIKKIHTQLASVKKNDI